MTGNWFCVPDGCARVSYRPYLPPGIRYRYPGEDWVSVDGDDYSLKKTYDFGNSGFYVYADATVQVQSSNPNFKYNGYGCNDTITIRSRVTISGGEILDYELNDFVERDQVQLKLTTNLGIDFVEFQYPDSNGNFPSYLNRFSVPYIGDCSEPEDPTSASSVGVKDVRNIRFEGISGNQPEIKSCTLTITKDGQVVYQETRDICPEVEREQTCKLSDTWQEIKVEKTNYLERVEVVPYEYKNFALGVYQGKIPEQCLNIYKNTTATIIPQFEGIPTPSNSAESTYGFIQQICSAPGCPPPEYIVTCDCDCQSCPDNTCAVFCDNHVCCADKLTGKTVIQIPLEDYCVEGF